MCFKQLSLHFGPKKCTFLGYFLIIFLQNVSYPSKIEIPKSGHFQITPENPTQIWSQKLFLMISSCSSRHGCSGWNQMRLENTPSIDRENETWGQLFPVLQWAWLRHDSGAVSWVTRVTNRDGQKPVSPLSESTASPPIDCDVHSFRFGRYIMMILTFLLVNQS